MQHSRHTTGTSTEFSRRALLAGAAAAGVAPCLRTLAAGAPGDRSPSEPIWDAHGHLNTLGQTPEEKIDHLLEIAGRMGIERVIVFMGYPMDHDPAPDEFRRQNDQVLRAIEHADGRTLGFAYINPRHTDESLKELDRCVAGGPMVGVKLWVAVRCHEPCLDPIVRRAVELEVPILQHTWSKITGNLPGESTAVDLAQLAARHPDASFIAAHVDGQWEAGLRAIRATPNVAAEICGSDPTSGMVEMAVRELGPERVIYGSDFPGRSFASQLAKVHGADISRQAMRLILAGNIKRLLAPALAARGIRA